MPHFDLYCKNYIEKTARKGLLKLYCKRSIKLSTVKIIFHFQNFDIIDIVLTLQNSRVLQNYDIHKFYFRYVIVCLHSLLFSIFLMFKNTSF